MILTGAMIAVWTAVATAAGATVVPSLASPAGPSKYQPPPPPIPTAEPSLAPTTTPSPEPADSPSPTPTPVLDDRPATAFTSWARGLSQPLDIPQIVLEAYGYAEWVLTQTRPGCKLQWTTLAAIGKVASDHGRLDGRVVDSQGWPRPVLMGPVLDGTGGRAKVADTDGGALDGNTQWDLAMGPMQLTAAMWRASGVDADGDELANPQDIDDAALAAGYHLCGPANKDLSVVATWKAAINGYHGMAPHIDKVFNAAQSYGVLSKNQRYPEQRR